MLVKEIHKLINLWLSMCQAKHASAVEKLTMLRHEIFDGHLPRSNKAQKLHRQHKFGENWRTLNGGDDYASNNC
jgi:hypothetical protein